MATIVKLGATARRRKVTREQERDLALLHLEKGYEASSKRCVELGLHKNYAVIAAQYMRLVPSGHRGTRSAPAAKPRSEISKRTFEDPRWKRAKSIGVVIA